MTRVTLVGAEESGQYYLPPQPAQEQQPTPLARLRVGQCMLTGLDLQWPSHVFKNEVAPAPLNYTLAPAEVA